MAYLKKIVYLLKVSLLTTLLATLLIVFALPLFSQVAPAAEETFTQPTPYEADGEVNFTNNANSNNGNVNSNSLAAMAVMGTGADTLLGPWWSSPLALSPSGSKVSNAFWRRRLLLQHLSVYLSETYDYSVYQLDGSADFSQSDAHIFSLLGASWLWNRYDYNGMDISDRFFSGKMLHPIEPTHHSLNINSLSLQLSLTPHYENFVQLTMLTAPVGPAIPYWKIVSQIYNHQASQLRHPPPTTKRRGQPFSFQFENSTVHAISNVSGKVFGTVASDLQVNYQNRSLLEFDAGGFKREYSDNNTSITAIAEAAFFDNAIDALKNSSFTSLLSVFFAEHLYATRYFQEEETADYTAVALSSFWRRRPYGYEGGVANLGEEVGFSLEQKNIDVHNLKAPYNVNRITGGEGLDPFYPSVRATLITPKVSLSYSLIAAEDLGTLLWHKYLPQHSQSENTNEHMSSLFLNNQHLYKGASEADVTFTVSMANTLGIVNPMVTSWEKPVYYYYDNSGVANFTSLHQMQLTSKAFTYGLIENSLRLSFNETEKAGIRMYAAAGLDIFGVVLRNDNIIKLSPQYKIGAQLLMPSLVNLRLELGRQNIPFTSNVAFFISKDYLNSKNFAWNDTGNGQLEEGEVSQTLVSTAGGQYHRVDKKLQQPHFYYINVPLSFKLPRNVVFSMSTHYSIFKNQLWVNYDGSDEDYGYFKEVDGERVFIENNGEKRYLVTNLNKSKFPNANLFNDSPFYVGGTLKLAAFGQRYFFSLAFTAYVVNGITREGNGFYHNSLGVLEESMARYQHRQLGRLDSDRGYLGRMLVAYEFHKYFFGSFSLSYRDGQPFGVFSPQITQDGDAQHVNWMRTKVSGDNIMLYNGEFGQREDAIWNFDVRFLFLPPLPKGAGHLELFLAVYNLLDLSLEVLEYYSYADKIKERAALETQHPRSLEIGFRYYY